VSETPRPVEAPVDGAPRAPRFSVGALVRLITDPARAAEELRHGLFESVAVIVPAAVLFAFCVQFMLPRLKDELPVLGSLRQGAAFIEGSRDLMAWKTFWPELLAALLCIAVWFAVYLAAGFVSRRRELRGPRQALAAAAAAAVPVLLTAVLALLLYQVRAVAGAVFAAGFLFGSYVCYHAQITRYCVPRWLAIYLAPLVFCVQMYIVKSFLP
jgi:ABC-type multidrug transport system permease subunit